MIAEGSHTPVNREPLRSDRYTQQILLRQELPDNVGIMTGNRGLDQRKRAAGRVDLIDTHTETVSVFYAEECQQPCVVLNLLF